MPHYQTEKEVRLSCADMNFFGHGLKHCSLLEFLNCNHSYPGQYTDLFVNYQRNHLTCMWVEHKVTVKGSMGCQWCTRGVSAH